MTAAGKAPAGASVNAVSCPDVCPCVEAEPVAGRFVLHWEAEAVHSKTRLDTTRPGEKVAEST